MFGWRCFKNGRETFRRNKIHKATNKSSKEQKSMN